MSRELSGGELVLGGLAFAGAVWLWRNREEAARVMVQGQRESGAQSYNAGVDFAPYTHAPARSLPQPLQLAPVVQPLAALLPSSTLSKQSDGYSRSVRAVRLPSRGSSKRRKGSSKRGRRRNSVRRANAGKVVGIVEQFALAPEVAQQAGESVEHSRIGRRKGALGIKTIQFLCEYARLRMKEKRSHTAAKTHTVKWVIQKFYGGNIAKLKTAKRAVAGAVKDKLSDGADMAFIATFYEEYKHF